MGVIKIKKKNPSTFSVERFLWINNYIIAFF